MNLLHSEQISGILKVTWIDLGSFRIPANCNHVKKSAKGESVCSKFDPGSLWPPGFFRLGRARRMLEVI
jgi:hypothetical protein